MGQDQRFRQKALFFARILSFIYLSAGLELVSQVSDIPDVVLVCCGGGGYLAGVAAALKLSGWANTDIYGIEPEKGIFKFYTHNSYHCSLVSGAALT